MPDLTDTDREELLRLVLTEASGSDVAATLGAYPVEARSTFRRVALQAGLVQATGVIAKGDEVIYEGKPKLSERGKKRLKELNERREKGEGQGH